MSQVHINIKQKTLRDTFSRRLLLLLGIFSVLTSIIITLAYQQQTDRFNRAELSGTLSHLLPRIQSQQLIWSDQANLLLGYIEFSGFLGLSEPQRHDQLQIFFTAMSENMGMDGIVISDTKNKRLIFSYWNNADPPDTGIKFSGERAYWYDDRHAVLYSVMSRAAQVPGYSGLEIYFFKAWDSAMFSRLDYPGITTYLTLGKQSLLSSAGNLALQEFKVPHRGSVNPSPLGDGVEYTDERL